MYFAWSDIYETGNELIDGQHQQIMAAVNDFYMACNSGSGECDVGKTLGFLLNYVFTHFQAEEELQRFYKYPEYMRHRQYHNAFRRTISGLASRLDREGPNVELLGTVYEEAGNWLTHHIQSDDFVLAAYIRSVSPYTHSARYNPLQQEVQKVPALLSASPVSPSRER